MDLLPTTELEAVNLALRGIGESPVNSIENSGVIDAVLAQQTLRFISSQVQEMGWHWNTRENYSLARTYPENEIVVPANTLKVDTVGEDEARNVILRGTRLYDKTSNTYTFDKALRVDLVEMLPFEELPQAARALIAIRAARKFQEDRLGSDSLSVMHRRDEAAAWAALVAAEAETGDHSIFNNYSVARVLDR